MSDWWNELLESRHEDGREDADKGYYNLPYQANRDPEDVAENEAYMPDSTIAVKSLATSLSGLRAMIY